MDGLHEEYYDYYYAGIYPEDQFQKELLLFDVHCTYSNDSVNQGKQLFSLQISFTCFLKERKDGGPSLSLYMFCILSSSAFSLEESASNALDGLFAPEEGRQQKSRCRQAGLVYLAIYIQGTYQKIGNPSQGKPKTYRGCCLYIYEINCTQKNT